MSRQYVADLGSFQSAREALFRKDQDPPASSRQPSASNFNLPWSSLSAGEPSVVHLSKLLLSTSPFERRHEDRERGKGMTGGLSPSLFALDSQGSRRAEPAAEYVNGDFAAAGFSSMQLSAERPSFGLFHSKNEQQLCPPKKTVQFADAFETPVPDFGLRKAVLAKPELPQVSDAEKSKSVSDAHQPDDVGELAKPDCAQTPVPVHNVNFSNANANKENIQPGNFRYGSTPANRLSARKPTRRLGLGPPKRAPVSNELPGSTFADGFRDEKVGKKYSASMLSYPYDAIEQTNVSSRTERESPQNKAEPDSLRSISRSADDDVIQWLEDADAGVATLPRAEGKRTLPSGTSPRIDNMSSAVLEMHAEASSASETSVSTSGHTPCRPMRGRIDESKSAIPEERKSARCSISQLRPLQQEVRSPAAVAKTIFPVVEPQRTAGTTESIAPEEPASAQPEALSSVEKVARIHEPPNSPIIASKPPPSLKPSQSGAVVTPPPGPPAPEECAAVESPAKAVPGVVSSGKTQKGLIYVNGRPFVRLEVIGRGGSSKVYKVMAPNNRIFAVKRVTFEKTDPKQAVAGYINEISLLRRLAQSERIIHLYDAEVDHSRGVLMMVMECGEIDLAHVLAKQQGKPVSLNFVRLYWEQMLQAVQAIHEEKIVHSDLKPANFLFVEGSLKLIDFGIAKSIPNDTTNVLLDQQVGTVNYMSPEAILDTNAAISCQPGHQKCMKLGRPSDVWSLGCILYQMIYGKTPYSHLAMYQKIQCIPDPTYKILYPTRVPSHRTTPPLTAKTTGSEDAAGEAAATLVPVDADAVLCMERCLRHDPKKRVTIPELLRDRFLRPEEPDLIAAGFGRSVGGATSGVAIDATTMDVLIREVCRWCSGGPCPSEDQVRRASQVIMDQIRLGRSPNLRVLTPPNPGRQVAANPGVRNCDSVIM